MPWVYSVDAGTPPTYTYSDVNTLNQHASAVNIPVDGAITQLKVYASGHNASVLTRLALWNIGGSVLQQSSTFTMAVGTESAGGQLWYTKSITPKAVSSGNYWVGLYRNPSGGHIAGTSSSGQDAYRKTNTSAFPSISTMSGYSTHSGREFYVGAFYITAPTAPSSLSVSRVSDTKQTITWTRNSSSDAPYDNLYLYRYDTVTGTYTLIATLSGSATSYSDTSTKANRYYTYKIRAKNTAGYSSYSNTDDIKTTPSSPTSVVATRVGTTVEINWNDNAISENAYTIARKTSTDNITWTSYSVLSSALSANTESYTDNTPANYNQYEVRADHSSPNVLHSSYTESNVVQILRYPNPPTNVQPIDYEAINIDGPINISWTHNPVDESEQTNYSIRFREFGGAWSLSVAKTASTEGSSSVSTASFTVGKWEFEVRTWGASTTGGESTDGSGYYEGSGYTLGSFTLSTQPEAVILSPTELDDYTTSSLLLTWTYSQDESNEQVQYIAKLYDANMVLLETQQASNDDENVTFVYTLENDTTYNVSIEVKESTGLWSEVTSVEFTTLFDVPSTPTIEVEEGDNATAIITITNPSPEGDEITTDHNVLYRSIDEGTTWEIAINDIPVNTTVTDYIPLSVGTTYYYVEAVSTLPSIAVSESASVTINKPGYVYFNTGDNFEDFKVVKGDLSLTERTEISKKVNYYEGRVYGTEYKTNRIIEQIVLSCDLPFSDYENFKNIINSTNNIFYRDYLSRHFYVSVGVPTFTKKDQSAYQFSCLCTRIEVD